MRSLQRILNFVIQLYKFSGFEEGLMGETDPVNQVSEEEEEEDLKSITKKVTIKLKIIKLQNIKLQNIKN